MSTPLLPTTTLPARNLCVRGLAVGRGERLLLEEIDVDLGPGDILVLRGPNGVGKSTLLSALAGLARPWRGSIRFSGADPDARPATDLHWLGHLTAVKPRLTVIENLKFWQKMNSAGQPAANAPTPEDALDIVGLGGLDMLDAGVLSAGQTKRLALARLLVSPRPIWLLDEPTAALDTRGDALVGQLLDAHRAQGGMAVVATHLDLALAHPPRTLTLGAPS